MNKHAQRKGRISSRKIRRPIVVALIVAVFALVATAAVSLRSGQTKNSRNSMTSSPEPGSSHANDGRAQPRFATDGSIPLDPQTGQVRPLTQDEAQRLAAGIKQLVNQSTDGLQSVKHADGTVSMDLQGRFQNIAVAKLDEDGKLTQSCVDNPESAAAFFGINPELVGAKAAGAPQVNATKVRDR
jgi:hypothetical protein